MPGTQPVGAKSAGLGRPRAAKTGGAAEDRLTAMMVQVSIAELNQSRQGSGAASNDAFAVIALDAAGVIGLGNAAAARAFPHHWWWALVGFGLSAAVASLVRLVPDNLPILGEMYRHARDRLPNEAEANRYIADRLLVLADGNLRAIDVKRSLTLVALVLLALSTVVAVVVFLKDFR